MPTPRRSLTVVLPIPSGQLGPNGRVHWRVRHGEFQRYKWEATCHIRNVPFVSRMDAPWQGAVQVDVLWVARQSNHLPDVDNLIARCKPYLDAGQAARLYANDRQVQIRSIRREVGKEPRVELTFSSEGEEA
jgi:Holliday junction resolvase RusA-like endonuclease